MPHQSSCWYRGPMSGDSGSRHVKN